MGTERSGIAKHCGYCGHLLAEDRAAPECFGERFCSEAHAEQFVAGVRAARMEGAARVGKAEAAGGVQAAGACSLPSGDQRGWSASLKRAVCWGAPLLLLLAIPLVWSGGWAATGGSVLSVLALLACPLGMYFMMRGMTSMQHPSGTPEVGSGERKETRRA
jgi:hypothetical protein